MEMKFIIILSIICTVSGYIMGMSKNSRFATSVAVDLTDSSDWPVWTGDRVPMPTLARFTQRMDATWGRGKFRQEVWEDKVNPENFWWLNYAPSKEEIEAQAQGYDFHDPKSWFEAKGIDYEQAKEKTKQLVTERLEASNKDTTEPDFSEEYYRKVSTEFLALQKKFFEYSFRYSDNLKQRAKGQPSLDIEDDGSRWKNEPI